MSHFIISYAGNKRNEYKHIKPHLSLENKKNIIEPFCGTSALSFHIWKEHKDKFNYFLNDSNDKLIEIYQLFKTTDYEKIEDEMNNLKSRITNKEEYNNLKKKDGNVFEYIYLNKYYSIQPGLYNEKNNTNIAFKFTELQKEFIDFIKQDYVHITSGNWETVFNQHKDSEKNLILLDPPYMISCNEFYKQRSLNIYEYLYNNKLDTFKSKIVLILEDIWFIRLLLSEFIKESYDKQYNTTKKKTSHIIITN
jgi:site-specific DNA-adenine methylase